MLTKWLYEGVRYEVERWPLYRMDQNLRYLAKHLFHRPHPASAEDTTFYRAQRVYLEQLQNELPNQGGVRLVAGGDLMWLRNGYADFASPGLKALLWEADATIANLETPVDPQRPVRRYTYETPRYNAPPEYLDAWVSCSRASVLSLCNNHALDQGILGLERTRHQVQKRGVVCIGGPGTLNDAVGLLNVRGLRLAFIGMTFGINGVSRASVGPQGIPILAFGDSRANTDWPLAARLIQKARALEPDHVIALPHWGYEYEYWPDARLRADAYRLIEMGCDILLGSSPHVLQPLEVASVNGWDGRAPTQISRPAGPPRPALIAYSLGNLASILPTVGCQVGALLDLRLSAQTLLGLDAVPTLCRRALGCSFLSARACLLDEAAALISSSDLRACRRHAERALAPFVAEKLP